MILQFVIVNPVYELHRDEFLHLDQANHLAFGFISLPPLTSLISKIIFLFGGDVFWIRFFPALFGSFTIVFAWLIAEESGGSLTSKIVVSAGLIFSALARLNILFQPNSFDIMIWTAIFWILIKYFKTPENKWLYLLSVVAAVGFYNKYNVVFLFAGLFIGLIATPGRKIFKNIAFWKAVALALLLILPNLIWQIKNGFPVVEHMKVLKADQLVNNTASGFLLSQLLFFFGSLPVIICALAALIFYKSFKPYRFIGIAFIVTISLFVILKAKDYYAIGLYPVLIAVGAVFIEKILKEKLKLIVSGFLIVANLGIFFMTAKVMFPLLSPEEILKNGETFEKYGLLRWEDGKNHTLPQDFSDMLGWREMAEKALLTYKMIPQDELDKTLIMCDNYGQVGALNYYNRGKMPEAYSFSTDYIYWLPHLNNIQNILLVGEKPEDEIVKLFSEWKLAGIVENEFAREKGTGIYLFRGAVPAFTVLFYKEADERKKNHDIF
ncbi:MAG: glycosyltransferase family 39 protein [Bacteroidales bacterium]|nr:glycosyltransferase family 39 protein [Bacteroidales bacterium]